MSASINRSLTTIKTELEFLLESDVITENLYDNLIASLPERYVKGMPPKDFTGSVTTTNSVTNAGNSKTKTMFEAPKGAPPSNDNLSSNNISIKAQSQPQPPPSPSPSQSLPDNNELAEAIYDYSPQQSDDLKLSRGDKIKILEKMSDSWWKGSCNGKIGVFPANYVKLYSNSINNSRSSISTPAPPAYQQYQQQQQQQQPYYQQQQYYQQPIQQGYYQQSSSTMNIPSQIPINQQPQQVQQVQQVQQQHHHSGLKKFGSKLGDAAIFGAGATIGSDLINSIF